MAQLLAPEYAVEFAPDFAQIVVPEAPFAGRMSRRSCLLALLAAGISPGSHSAGLSLPVPASLPEALAQALRNKGPLVVMVSLERCPFCKVARENYLLPLQRQNGLAVVQIDMRSSAQVVGFNGSTQTHDSLVRSWGIKVAPTVLFFGRGGQEVAERLVGGYIADFYGAYLDERLQTARAAVSA